MEKAAARADKMEDAALLKLREQAIERVQQLQTTIEEELNAYQENAKAQIDELQGVIADYKETWKNDAAEFESQQHSHREEWKKDIQDVDDRLEAQREAWELAVEDGSTRMQQLLADLKTISEESRDHLATETGMMDQRLQTVRSNVESMVNDLEQRITTMVEDTEQRVLEAAEERLKNWSHVTREAETNTRQLLTDLEASSREIKTHFTAETDAMEDRLKELEVEIDKSIAALRNQVMKAAEDIEVTVLEEAGTRLEQWKQAAEERDLKAQEQLAQLEDSVETFKTRFATEIQNMEERFKNLGAETNETITELQDQVAHTSAETRAKVAEDMDARIEQWKDAAEAENARVRQLLLDLETLSAETEKQISHEIAGATQGLAVIQTQLDELSSRIETEVATAGEQALSLADRELEKWKQAIEVEDTKARELLAGMENSLEDTKQQVSDEIAAATAQIQGIHTMIDDAVSQVEAKITNTIGTAEEQALSLADRELEKWRQVVEMEDAKVQELLAGMENSLGDMKQQVSDEIAAATGRIESLHRKIEETTAHIEVEIAGAITDAQERASDLAAGELEKWKQAVEAEDARARELLAGMENSLGDTKQQVSDEIAAATGQIESLHRKIEETTAHIEVEIAGAITDAQERASDLAAGELEKWKQAAEERDTIARQILSNVETSLEHTEQQVSGEIASVTGQIETLQSRVEEIASRIETEMTQAVNKVETEAATLAGRELEKWKQAVEAEDAQLRDLLAGLEASMGTTKQELSDEIARATVQCEALQAKVNETAGYIQEVMTAAVNTAKGEASDLAAGELEKWKQAVKAEDAKVQDVLSQVETISQDMEQRISGEAAAATERFQDLQTKINETAGHIQEVMTAAVSGAEARALSLADTGLERWRLAAEEGDMKARQLFADLESASAEAKQYIFNEIAVNTARFEELQTKIQEIASGIEDVMAQAVSKAEEKAFALTDMGLEKWKQAAEEGDARTRQLFADLERVSSQTKQHVFDEITAAQERFDALEHKIEETASHIEAEMTQAVQTAEEKAAALAGAGLEKWKSAMKEGDAETQKLILDLQTVSEESLRNLRDLEQRLMKISEDTERKALEDGALQLEKCKQAITEVDAKVRQLMAELETSFMDTKTHLLGEITEAENQIKTIQSQIDEAVSLLDNEMTLAVGKAKAKALAVAQEEDAKVRQLLTDLETSFTDTKQHLFNEITEAETRIGTIQSRIDETYSHIEDEMAKAVGNAEERSLILADAGLEKWKASVEAEDAKVRRLLTDLETAAAGNEKDMAALEQRLVTITGDMERRVLEVTDERLETWKLITSEAETGTRQLLADLEAASGEIKIHFTAENTAMEQRLKDLQDHADEAMQDIKSQVEKISRDTEQRALEDMDVRLEKWKDAAEAEDARVHELLSTLETSSATIEQRIQDIKTYINDTIATLEARLLETTGEIEQKVLEETDTRLGEYRAAQAEQFKRWETLADDTSGMDTELRRYMAEIETRVREDFSRFEHNSVNDRDRVAAEFNAAVQLLKTELEAVGQELADIKTQAYHNVSEKFQGFEDDFSADIAKRSEDIERRLTEWQESLQVKLAGFMEESEVRYRNMELSLNEELRNKYVEQHEQLVSELEHLKVETGNFEEGIRSQMKVADDSLSSFKTQLHQDMEEARNTAEASVKAELGRYALSMAENLKQSQRDIEAQIKKVADQVEVRNHEITGLLETARQELDRWQTGFNTELQRLDASMNEARRRAQELISESDERLSSIRSTVTDVNKEAAAHRAELFAHIDEQVKILDSAIKEADRHIKEFTSQTRLFERTDELKVELERRLEDLRGDFDRIDQRRAEAMDLEGQFVKIKRLEDEVNAKMTRFLSEKHRIEQMETEFNRLLQVSTAVEEKLTEVSNSDDTLQGIQIQIRKLNDALGDAEDKYQRLEKKNQTLDTTNDGIDRNFKALQESEKMARHITDELTHLSTDISSLRSAIESLTEDNTRARETADKLSLLDASLSSIEDRIEEMQKARQWLARAETRLEELNKQSLDQVKLMDTMRNADKTIDEDKGAPPLGVRDNITRLARLGWTVDEIARAVKRSRGEVELILEIMPKE